VVSKILVDLSMAQPGTASSVLGLYMLLKAIQ